MVTGLSKEQSAPIAKVKHPNLTLQMKTWLTSRTSVSLYLSTQPDIVEDKSSSAPMWEIHIPCSFFRGGGRSNKDIFVNILFWRSLFVIYFLFEAIASFYETSRNWFPMIYLTQSVQWTGYRLKCPARILAGPRVCAFFQLVQTGFVVLSRG